MRSPLIRKKYLLIAGGIGSFIIIPFTIIFIQIYTYRKQQVRIDSLETYITEQFNNQTMTFFGEEHLVAGVIEQRMMEMEDALGQLITGGIATTGNRIAGTNSRVARIDAVYTDLLKEQKKKTLDTLYTENEIYDKEQEAGRLFRTENYAAATTLYAVVAEARPENIEARFYRLYSLFLSNKMDKGNYRQIREGLAALERNGYQRGEIKKVLEFINAEEAGIAAGYTGGTD